MEQPDWISAHFFYHGDLSALLKGCVQPLLAHLGQSGLIASYFFVRYWQGGPHLRLRLLPRTASASAQIMDEVRQAAARYFQQHPAPDSLDVERYEEISGYLSYMEYGRAESGPLYPNNSLHFLPYVPEYEHYGGRQAMPAVEEHFEESSAIALALLTQGADRKQRTAHSVAAMLLTAALANPTRAATAQVIEHFYFSWERMPASLRTSLLARFDQQYEEQRQRLEQLSEQLLRLSAQQESDLDDSATLLRRWLRSIRRLYRRLCELDQAGLLVSPQVPATPTSPVSPPLNILLRCAHMHNNRLGLLLLEEAYVLHLLKRALSEGSQTSGSDRQPEPLPGRQL
ncbi:MAG: thiopeptide-type bacteriocin biosynthesis protein [Thermogemmatispora sp.]|uniref:thiopeptide-type bacteriocin biosynthesis protein n=1 Tax=Thermogemmatispora sp. TaxID=1968838 RepID=UPI0026169A27|nr:thiopeptide-type bacteriocin biosynthesis protein [Thermogemmatispora sp.]MBX5457529.1 thiopeptide-type bacteriocin biosynthesis protein [Thermogemmatispora sp.]